MHDDQEIKRKLLEELAGMSDSDDPSQASHSDPTDNLLQLQSEPLAKQLQVLRQFDSRVADQFTNQLSELRTVMANDSTLPESTLQQIKKTLVSTMPHPLSPPITEQEQQVAAPQIPSAVEQQPFIDDKIGARLQAMRAEREEVAMWREDRHSRQVQEETHMALFANRLYHPTITCPPENHLHFRLQLSPPPMTFCQMTPLQNTQANRLPKNDPVLALPALKSLPTRTPSSRIPHNLRITFSPSTKPPTVQQQSSSSTTTASYTPKQEVCHHDDDKIVGLLGWLERSQELLARKKYVAPRPVQDHEKGFAEDCLEGCQVVSQFIQASAQHHCRELDLRFEAMTELGHLTNLPYLQTLLLQHNQLNQISSLSLPQLTYLNLSHNKITKLPDTLPCNLKKLDASFNNLSAFTYLVDAGEGLLQELDLTNNKIGRIELGGRLRLLRIGGNVVSQARLEMAAVLECLEISHNQLRALHLPYFVKTVDCRSNSIDHLHIHHPFLNILKADQNQLTTFDLEWAPSLTHISLSNNKLPQLNNGRGVPMQPNLRSLDISNNRVTSFKAIYQCVVGSSLLHSLNYNDNNLRHCSSRVLDFYQHVLTNKLPHLSILNLLDCKGRAYNKAQFRGLFTSSNTIHKHQHSTRLLFDQLARQSQLIHHMDQQHPFLQSSYFHQYQQSSMLSFSRSIKSTSSIQLATGIFDNFDHQKAIYQIRHSQACARISRLCYKLRKYLVKRNAYFKANHAKVLDSVSFLLQLKQTMLARWWVNQLSYHKSMKIAVLKIERAYLNFINRRKFNLLKQRLVQNEQEDEDYLNEEVDFFQHKEVIKPIKLVIPKEMFMKNDLLTRKEVKQAEQYVQKKFDADEFIAARRNVLKNNFMVDVDQIAQPSPVLTNKAKANNNSEVVNSQLPNITKQTPTKAQPKPHVGQSDLFEESEGQGKKWSQDQRVNHLLQAKRRRAQNIKHIKKLRKW